jgi:hypothetical protein
MPFENSDLDGNLILNWILKENECIGWINMIRKTVQWQDLVKIFMKLRVP